MKLDLNIFDILLQQKVYFPNREKKIKRKKMENIMCIAYLYGKNIKEKESLYTYRHEVLLQHTNKFRL